MKVSVHETIEEMYEKVRKDGVTNIADRYESQKIKCQFCTQGLSCQLCSMGPCRIRENAPVGACGIDANAMAMRNMLHRHVMGAAAYTYHAIEAAKTLKATAEGKTPFEIRDKDKLIWFAKQLGIETEGREINEIAKDVADFVLEELNKNDQSKIVEIFAPKRRKDVWKKLGLMPSSPMHEIVVSATSAMTNIDTNYVSLVKKGMKMGIATCMVSQLTLEIIQDILFGTPKPHEAFVDLGIVDPDYVNIAVNGHEPFVGYALIKLAESEEVQKKAREAGAKGLRIIGSIETGQEILQRTKSEVFVGLTGNWITQEFLLATGAIDVFAMDMNCSLPTLPEYQRYGVKLVPVSKLVRLRGIDEGLDYEPEKAEEIARKLIDMAIENFKERKAKIKPYVPKRKQKVLVGFSTESILEALGGKLDPLIEAIKSGDIKGIVALVSCTTLRNGPHDYNTVTIAKELIKRDILVLSMGCGNAAVQVAGLTSLDAIEQAGDGLKKVCKALNIPPVLSYGTCTDTGRLAHLVGAIAEALDVDVPDLPIAATAPEYMEQKATIDAVFAVAYGVTVHVSPIPPITGAKDLVKLLTEDAEKLVGGKVIVEEDPVKAAEKLEHVILEKRKALGI